MIATAAPLIKSIYRVKTIGVIAREGNMKMTASQCISALFMTTVLAGCQMIPLQNRGVTSAESDAPLSVSAGWAKIVEMDRESVRRGLLSPEVIPYDLQIAQMIPEGREIRASHDQAKARIWSEKMNSLLAARNTAMGKMTAREMAQNNATPNAWANAKPDPCLSPMGKNICTAPPAQQGGVNYSAGPSGIGATVGGILVGPGGISGPTGSKRRPVLSVRRPGSNRGRQRGQVIYRMRINEPDLFDFDFEVKPDPVLAAMRTARNS